jgi:hypothetical protein
MQNMMRDFRHALRQLRQSPSFAVAAIFTLALGIGANLALFSGMNAILFNPSGIPHPERVVAVGSKYAMVYLKNINLSPPHFMSSLLHGVRSNAVATLASVSTAWIGIALLAAKVDPMVVLRHE